MKKLIIVVLVVFIVVTFGACDDNKTVDNSNGILAEGDLLYEIGADSLDDVKNAEIQCKCDCPGDKIIEDTDDLKFLSNYKYESDYPQDKLADLLLFPNNFLFCFLLIRGYLIVFHMKVQFFWLVKLFLLVLRNLM